MCLGGSGGIDVVFGEGGALTVCLGPLCVCGVIPLLTASLSDRRNSKIRMSARSLAADFPKQVGREVQSVLLLFYSFNTLSSVLSINYLLS